MRVASLGVDYGQGFAIARPVPLTEVLAELPMYAAADEITVTAEQLKDPHDMPEGVELQLDDDPQTRIAAG
jgi:EAL domain-containing protein (putative c-di-GMP-specific phosphodiesterase class I)